MIRSNVNEIFHSVTYTLHTVNCVVIIDPGNNIDMFEYVDFVFLSHAHFDHIYGLNKIITHNKYVKIYTNESGREMLLNARKNLSFYHETPFVISDPSCIVVVDDGDEVDLGEGITAKAIFTPGHNPSCITWLIGDALFTGDSYIPGLKTVTNLPGGNKQQAEESIALIKKLAVGRTIYPGHKI